MNTQERTWFGRSVRQWVAVGSGALLVLQPVLLMCWFEYRQPGFLAEMWAGRTMFVWGFGILLVVGTIGAGVLEWDSIRNFQSHAPVPVDCARQVVRPFFRVLCGCMGLVMTTGGLLIAYVFWRALVESPKTAENFPVWFWLFLVVGILGCALLGPAFLHACVFGRQPGWWLRLLRCRCGKG